MGIGSCWDEATKFWDVVDSVTHYMQHRHEGFYWTLQFLPALLALSQNKVITGLYHLGKAFGDGGDINGSCIDKDNHFRGITA